MLLGTFLLLERRHQESNTIPDTSTVLVLAYCLESYTSVKKTTQKTFVMDTWILLLLDKDYQGQTLLSWLSEK